MLCVGAGGFHGFWWAAENLMVCLFSSAVAYLSLLKHKQSEIESPSVQ